MVRAGGKSLWDPGAGMKLGQWAGDRAGRQLVAASTGCPPAFIPTLLSVAPGTWLKPVAVLWPHALPLLPQTMAALAPW